MKSMRILALAVAVLALPAVARADGDYRFELTPSLSYHFGGSFDSESTSGVSENSLKLDNGLAYGIAFDIPLSNNLQLELMANRQSTDLSTDSGIFRPSDKKVGVDITYAHVGLLAQFGQPSVSPYFVASLGMTRIDPNNAGAGTSDKFSASLGVGVKLFFTPFLGLRFEGRAFWTDIGGGRVVCNGQGCIQYRDYLSQGEATVGLIFAW